MRAFEARIEAIMQNVENENFPWLLFAIEIVVCGIFVGMFAR